MSKLPPFVWRYTDLDRGWIHGCKWEGLTLYASEQGTWSVRQDGQCLITSNDQTPGSDIEEAKRRAQGAAIALRKPLVNAEK